MSNFILKIKRKEGFLATLLNKLYYYARGFNIPSFFLPFYRICYKERFMRISFFRRLFTFIYWSPMFRSKCMSVGNSFNYVKLEQNFPYFSGNLSINLGSNVTVHSRSSFSAGKVLNNPELIVGNDTYIGPGFSISISKKVVIGNKCHIASNVIIMDNDGHPLDPDKRAKHQTVDKENILPVIIEDNVWIGSNSIILKGVIIHKYSVIAAQSVVSRNVEQYTVVAGNPAKVIKKLLY